MEQVTLTVLIGIITSLLGAYLGYKGYERNLQRENRNEGKEFGVILTEIGYIKSGIDDLEKDQHEQVKLNTEIHTRLAMLEASLKQAHFRIDRNDDALKLDRRHPAEA